MTVVLLAALAATGQQVPDTVVVAPITVVARAPDVVSRLPLAATVLTLDPARAVTGRSLADLLMVVPGLYTSDRGNPAQDDAIAVRGVGARAAFGVRGVRVFLDGIPQTLPDGQTQVTAIDPAELERVEVLRGAASAWYGNAAGGAVLFATAVPAGTAARAAVRVGADGAFRVGLGGTLGDGARGLRIAGARESADGYRAHAAYETWRAGLSARAPALGGINAVHLTLTHQPTLEDPGALTAAEFAADPRMAAPAFLGANARERVTHVQGGTAQTWTRGTVDATVALWGQRRELETWLPFVNITLGRAALGLRVSADWRMRDRLMLGGGVEAQGMRDDRVNRTPDGATVTRDQIERATEAAPWLQARWRPADLVTVQATARVDAVRFSAADRLLADGDGSGTRTLWAPSVAVGVTAAAHAAFRPWVGLATLFESPTTTELANRADGGAGFNPDLDPERGVQFEAGVRGSAASASWEVVGWRAWVRDGLVPFESPLEPGRVAYRNAGRLTRTGLEVAVALRPMPLLALEGSVTLSDFVYGAFTTTAGTFDGNRVPGVPERQGAGRARVGTDRAWASLDMRTRSRLIANDANSAEAAGWTTLGARAGGSFRMGGTDVAAWVAVENLLDDPWAAGVRVNANAGRYYDPGAGRTLAVAFSVSPRLGARSSSAPRSPR